MEAIVIISAIIFIIAVINLFMKEKEQSIEEQRKQFETTNPSSLTNYKADNYSNNDENNGSYVDDVYDDIKAKPNSKDSWLGLSEEEMEEVYYRLKADKIKLSDTMYKYIANIIGEQYEDDLLEELQYVDEYSISEWIDEKRREKRFLTNKVWRKIKYIQSKRY